MSEHQRVVEGRDPKSQIYKHCFETEGHRFDFDAVKIVATEKLESSRRFLKGIHTKINNNATNIAVHIPGFYFEVLGIGKRSLDKIRKGS